MGLFQKGHPGGPGRTPKVTKQQREEMLELYTSGKCEEADKMAASLGVHKEYAYRLASSRGLLPKTWQFNFSADEIRFMRVLLERYAEGQVGRSALRKLLRESEATIGLL